MTKENQLVIFNEKLQRQESSFYFYSDFFSEQEFHKFSLIAKGESEYFKSHQYQFKISPESDRSEIVNSVFHNFQIKDQSRYHHIKCVIEELVMNAQQACTISVIRVLLQAPFLMVCVKDQAGILDAATIRKSLIQQLPEMLKPNLEEGKGAGLGLMLVYMHSICSFFKLNKNISTEISVLFRLDLRQTQKEEIMPSLVIFEGEDA